MKVFCSVLNPPELKTNTVEALAAFERDTVVFWSTLARRFKLF